MDSKIVQSNLMNALISDRARRRGKFWAWILIPPLLGLAAYVGLCVFFVVNQRAFQYAPGGGRTTPEAVGLVGFAAIDVRTEDGERLDAWWAPPPVPGGGVVLFLHGTPGTLANTAWVLADLREAGLGAMAIDYRGYGGSTGAPTEAGLRLDARAAFDTIRKAAPGSRVAVFAESFGTGPAVALARERPVAGLLLSAPYASVRRLFELKGPPLPYRWLMRDQFDSEAVIGGVAAPLMILHRTSDPDIPVGEARRLFAAAREPKAMIEAEGDGHLDAYTGVGKRPALDALVRWTTPGTAAVDAGR
jgi:fermentation-respiration switch protein FrsA (DUF1100 family)